MGKIRNIFARLLGHKVNPQVPPICTHSSISNLKHYTKLVVNATDHCYTCQIKMCLVCSQHHITNYCHVKTVNNQFGTNNLLLFNQGHLMKIRLEGTPCICGKPLKYQKDHAMCAACGVATCSQQCHDEWERQGNCTYNKNYFQKPKQINMRSIIFTNIVNIQKARISQWNLANKNALSYIACYAKHNADYVYLQRGYRNYGNPQPALVQKMTPVPLGIDFYTHVQRICTCTCEICTQREVHSVGNCTHHCMNTTISQYQYQDQAQLYQQCTCTCKFCAQGVVVNRHTKYECKRYCLFSDQ